MKRIAPPWHAPRLLLPLAFLSALAVARGVDRFDVVAGGASPDGATLCTAAIQKTIERCAAAGGGEVVFPPGGYLSGTLHLRDGVTLRIEAGATLIGSPDAADYPDIRVGVRSYTDNYVRKALIAGENLERVGIRGGGVIDGNGGRFRWKEYLTRPYVIRLVACEDVTVEGVTLRDSPMWMQHYLACERVRIRGVRVHNHVSYNNDGVDIDGCRDVAISDCIIDSDDDALCLKSTLDRPCENVAVTNCVLSSHCNAFKCGTESNGGFRNVTVSNCAISSPRASKAIYGQDRGMCGIALESVDGGTLEGVTVSGVTIRGVNVPFFLRLGNRARPFVEGSPKPGIGAVRDVILRGIVATDAAPIGCSITGLPGHPVENVTVSDVHVGFAGGGTLEMAGREVPEKPEAYPESKMFGELPAYALYVRHARGVTVRGLRARVAVPDLRHALVADDVEDLTVDGLTCARAAGGLAPVSLVEVRGAALRGCRVAGGGAGAAFLRLAGAGSRRIALALNDLPGFERPVEFAKGAPADAVIAP